MPGTVQQRLPIQVLEEIASYLIDEETQLEGDPRRACFRAILGQELWDAFYEGLAGNVEMWMEVFDRVGVQ